MKRGIIAAALLCLLFLAGCGGRNALTPLEDLPEDYSVEDAKDGCVVSEDGEATNGQETWSDFYETVSKGEAAAVRLCGWFTLESALEGLSPDADPEYLASLEAEYPALSLADLTFDGASFTLTRLEHGREWTETYSYLRRFERGASLRQENGTFTARYLLTDDRDATYEQLFGSLLSAKLEDHLHFTVVYSEPAGKT